MVMCVACRVADGEVASEAHALRRGGVFGSTTLSREEAHCRARTCAEYKMDACQWRGGYARTLESCGGQQHVVGVAAAVHASDA